MIQIQMTEADEKWAREYQAGLNVKYAGQKTMLKPGTARWAGYVGETGVDRWLSEQKIPHKWILGEARESDFLIWDRRVEVKTQVSEYRLQPDWRFQCAVKQLKDEYFDHMLFTWYVPSTRILTLVGMLSVIEFERFGFKQKKGDKSVEWNDHHALTDTLVVEVSNMMDVSDWLFVFGPWEGEATP